MKQGTYVVAAFSGTGKSTLGRLCPDMDSVDSSHFTQDPVWPTNYIRHIKDNIEDGTLSLVSTHDVVRQGLINNKIPFFLVYPTIDQKEEYLSRIIKRGDELRYLDIVEKNWDAWINECMAQEGCTHIVLRPGQFLTDVIDVKLGARNEEFEIKR